MSEFLCWMPAFGESKTEGIVVHAMDAWHAVKRYVEALDNSSGAEMSSNALKPGHPGYTIHALTPEGIETQWHVFPECEVRWYARARGVVQQADPSP